MDCLAMPAFSVVVVIILTTIDAYTQNLHAYLLHMHVSYAPSTLYRTPHQITDEMRRVANERKRAYSHANVDSVCTTRAHAQCQNVMWIWLYVPAYAYMYEYIYYIYYEYTIYLNGVVQSPSCRNTFQTDKNRREKEKKKKYKS